MPTTNRRDLPGTIQRSPAKAQRTYAKAHDNAVEQYGEGERAHRTAIAAVKHSFEKVGDHWEPKDRKGPSDPRAARRGNRGGRTRGKSYGGVDYYGRSKQELYERAKELKIPGRSSMSKDELASAIGRKQR
jgi:cation transport regulator ChaB